MRGRALEAAEAGAHHKAGCERNLYFFFVCRIDRLTDEGACSPGQVDNAAAGKVVKVLKKTVSKKVIYEIKVAMNAQSSQNISKR